MRKGILWLAALLLPLIFAACADLPTSPIAVPGENDALANCHWRSDGSVYCDPVSPDWECDPWQSLDWCNDDGSCMTSDPSQPSDPVPDATVQGCPGDGGGDPGGGGTPPGGGTTPPPPAEPTDTCNTGDAVVDDPQVSDGLQDLWAQSNPDANLAQRAEKAGWIVEYPAGQFSVVQWSGGTESFGCGDYTSLTVPSQGTVVGFVHTHPYQVDETILDCKMTNVQDYTGAPSEEDRIASKILGNFLGRSDPLPGYIIDKDGYYRFQGSTYTATPRLPRCGY
jgi:hypothetical protein